MIEAVLMGGWKSIATAAILMLMSILSLSSLVAEGLRVNREIKNAPKDRLHESGIWLDVRHNHDRLYAAGFRGEDLISKMRAASYSQGTKGSGHASILASIGANAPYIGLFGTVLGIYGALHALGLGGSINANLLAGSVGEALIMTALGLLVAIPAVFGFNYILSRRQRLSEMQHAYGIYIATGILSGPHMRILNGNTYKNKKVKAS